MTIEKSTIEDDKILTEITKKSKAYWGYTAAQMHQWSELLTITPTYIKTNQVFKLRLGIQIVGYYSYIQHNEHMVQLDNLFILPSFIGQGLGTILMNHLLERLKTTSTKKIILDSEPHAEHFYQKFGFITTGQTPTSIQGRYLPAMELNL